MEAEAFPLKTEASRINQVDFLTANFDAQGEQGNFHHRIQWPQEVTNSNVCGIQF